MVKRTPPTVGHDQEIRPEDVNAWLASAKLDEIESYVASGRRFASLETEALKADWVETYRAAVRVVEHEHDFEKWRKFADLESELLIRKESAPYDLVREETKHFKKIIQAKRSKSQPDPGSRKQLTDQFDRFMKARKKGH
jgi:hypothetical protein